MNEPDRKRPLVSTNLAISADGKISPSRQVAGAFTAEGDSQRFHQLRGGCQALLVGRGTLEADRMTMRVAGREVGQQPLRCVVSRSGSFDWSHPLFSAEGGQIHLLITESENKQRVADELSEHGFEGVRLHCLPLAEFLQDLAETYAVDRLHCEGGGGVIQELARLDWIDEFNLTISGRYLFGGREAPSPTGGWGSDFLPASRKFKLVWSEFDRGGEALLSYRRVNFG